MSFRFDIPGVLWVPGKLLRGRLINGDTMANAAELALGETPLAGGVSMYSGTSSIANPTDSIAAPYLRQVRQVTAQTTVSFDDATTAQGVIPPTEFAYLSNGYALPALPAGSLQALTAQTNTISTLFINNKLFIRADVEAIAANTSAASVTGNLMNVNLTGAITRPIQVTVRDITIDSQ